MLTDDDVSSGARTKAVHRLERTGVDVERLEADFVSHRAMRTYLTAWRGAAYQRLSDDEKSNTIWKAFSDS